MILAQKIKYYINNLKDLQKKVKSFAKFILIVYVQLQFMKNVILELFNKKERFRNNDDNNNLIDYKIEKQYN